MRGEGAIDPSGSISVNTSRLQNLMKFMVGVVIFNWRVRFVPDFENLEGMENALSFSALWKLVN